MSAIQVHLHGTKIIIDHDKGTIGTLYPGSLDVRDIYSLKENWIQPYLRCRVCQKEFCEDQKIAYSYWNHQPEVCNIECFRKETLARYACCDKATHRGCVCKFSTVCPIHGIRCVGTHD